MGRGQRGEGFTGTTIKDTRTKPRGSGNRGRRWGWLGLGGVVGDKCRQLYLNNNKIIKKFKKRNKPILRICHCTRHCGRGMLENTRKWGAGT